MADLIVVLDGARVVEVGTHDELMANRDRYAELYGSPAIAGGRVFLSTEGWLYAIGDKTKSYEAEPDAPAVVPAGSGDPAFLQVVPTEIELLPGEVGQAAIAPHPADVGKVRGRLKGHLAHQFPADPPAVDEHCGHVVRLE